MKFQSPTLPQAEMQQWFDDFMKEIDDKFYGIKDTI